MSIRAKRARLASQQQPLPSYISPWKQIDTTRELETQLTKNRLLEEIFVSSPFKQQNHSAPQPTPPTPSRMRSRLGATLDFKTFLGKKASQSDIAHYQHYKAFEGRGDREQNEVFDRLVFVKKSYPAFRMRVVSLGTEQGELTDLKRMNGTSTTFKTEALNVYTAKAGMPSNWRSRRPTKKTCQFHNQRTAYKRISQSLLDKLNGPSKAWAPEVKETKLLNKTLQSFISQQKRI